MAEENKSNLGMILAIPVLLLLIIGGIGLFWLQAANVLRENLDKFSAMLEKNNYQLSYEDKGIQGFPFASHMRLENVSLTAPPHKGWAYKTSKLILDISAFNTSQLTLDFSGTHEVRRKGREAQTFRVKEGKFDIGLSGVALSNHYGLTIKDLSENDGRGIGLDLLELSFDPINMTTLSFQDETLRLNGRLENARFAPGFPNPFNGNLKKIVFEGSILGPIRGDRFLDSLEVWREKGGTIDVRQFFLDWDSFKLQAVGTLALDLSFQPIGALTARASGLMENLRKMHRTGLIRTKSASMARVVLGRKAQKVTADSPSLVSFSLSMQNSGIYADSVRMVEMPTFSIMGDTLIGAPNLKPGVELDKEGRARRMKKWTTAQ